MIIDGKKLSLEHEQKLKEKIKTLSKTPHVVSFLIGQDPASILYSNMKQKKAKELGIDFQIRQISPDISFEQIVLEINKLNHDENMDGIMIQLPLPQEFLKDHQTEELLEKIDPLKDIDGLTGKGPFLSATAGAVLSILKDEGITLVGKKIVVVGAKGEIGKELMKILERKGVDVLGIDKETSDLSQVTRQADLLISTTGIPGLIKGEMIKDGAVVIDVGISKIAEKVAGDVDFESVSKKASKISPVPGGVGPMTIITLMENVVKSVERN